MCQSELDIHVASYVVIDYIRKFKFKTIQLETDNDTCIVQHSIFFFYFVSIKIAQRSWVDSMCA